MKRKLRFVPYKVQIRDFRKWARQWRGAPIPRPDHDDYVNRYITRDLTTEQVQEIFEAGWDAAENRQENGGMRCGD